MTSPPTASSRDLAVRRLRRPGRLVPVLAALGLAAGLLAGCSNDALALARQACGHIDRSLTLYHQAVKDAREGRTDQARRGAENALQELQEALPLAAAATSADPIWNPLQTTLQLANRTSESNLVGALRRQCAMAATPSSGTPGSNTTTPPTTTTSPAH